MSRRDLLWWMGGAALAACSGGGHASTALHARRPAAPVRAVAFDLFTLFDPRGVERRVSEVLGPHDALAASWKGRLFEYCWLHAVAGRYRDFEVLVTSSLSYAACAHGLKLDDRQRKRLESVFCELEPWPDSASTLDLLRERGLRLAPLANFAPRMIERLLGRARLRGRFETLISTHQARSYKPAARAYALAEQAFALPREQIAFSAFGGWDAAGAHWFGFPTFWVNRLDRPREELHAGHAEGRDLAALTSWLLRSGDADR